MSKQVTAKFLVTKKSKVLYGFTAGSQPVDVVSLNAVRGEPFGSMTPAGQIEMTIHNTAAADQFEVGKEYFVTFSEDDPNDSADTPEER